MMMIFRSDAVKQAGQGWLRVWASMSQHSWNVVVLPEIKLYRYLPHSWLCIGLCVMF